MNSFAAITKTALVLFTAAFLVACSGSDTKDADDAAARAAAEAAAAEEAAMAEREASEARLRNLQDAVVAAGNVFFFEFDSSVLTPEAQRALDAHIALLVNNNGMVRLGGHTDERGTREYNMALGERRGNAVRDYMVLNGVDGSRIEVISYGEEKPAVYGSGESAWSQNRRVVLQ